MLGSFFESLFFGCGTDSTKNAAIKQAADKYCVLDLDETLIHTELAPFPSANCILIVNEQKIYVSERPHLHFFLEEISKYYTMVIYTTGAKAYAEEVVKNLGISKYMKYLLHRDHCVEYGIGMYTKDISFLEVPLERIVLIDDNPSNALLQPANSLLISQFRGEATDQGLLKLIPFLKDLSFAEDVRDVRQKYKEYNQSLKWSVIDSAFQLKTKHSRKRLSNLSEEEEKTKFAFKVSSPKMSESKARIKKISLDLGQSFLLRP